MMLMMGGGGTGSLRPLADDEIRMRMMHLLLLWLWLLSLLTERAGSAKRGSYAGLLHLLDGLQQLKAARPAAHHLAEHDAGGGGLEGLKVTRAAGVGSVWRVRGGRVRMRGMEQERERERERAREAAYMVAVVRKLAVVSNDIWVKGEGFEAMPMRLKGL
jgi:hypothetical protein